MFVLRAMLGENIECHSEGFYFFLGPVVYSLKNFFVHLFNSSSNSHAKTFFKKIKNLSQKPQPGLRDGPPLPEEHGQLPLRQPFLEALPRTGRCGLILGGGGGRLTGGPLRVVLDHLGPALQPLLGLGAAP